MEEGKILIVDEAKSYWRLSELLEGSNYSISVSHHTDHALEAIQSFTPDLVIIDIHIADNRGINLCKSIKNSDGPMKDVMVVFMTVSGFPYLIGQAYKAGAKDFITKPFSPIETVLRIKSLVELAQTQLRLQHALNAETQALETAREASKVKSQFLSVMSHELRTPLNAICGFADLLLLEDLEDNQQYMIKAVQQSSDLLLRIVNDILDITKIEAAKIELDLTEFSLETAVQDVVNILDNRAEFNSVEFNVELDTKYQQIIGDKLKLQQVLINLLSNALKFTEKGAITLRVIQKGSLFYFEVIDTGIGMSKEQTRRIFQPFTQADSSTTRRYGGTGLGLSISYSFVEALGGILEVESKLGVGSRFHFTLELPKELPKSRTSTFFKCDLGNSTPKPPRLNILSVV